MFIDLLKYGYYLTNLDLHTSDEWINFCESFIKIRQFPNFWSMIPNTDDKVMLLSTKKINKNQDCHVSRPVLLDWHYDGIGIVNREDLICLYCKIPNSVTSILNLNLLYENAPNDIKKIINKTVIELDFNEDIYKSSLREKVSVKKVNNFFEKENFKPMTVFHPITGKLAALYHKNFVNKLHGLTNVEEKLFLEYYNDSFNLYIYNHYWEKNDILIIDQNSSIHSRDPFVGERELWRISGWFK